MEQNVSTEKKSSEVIVVTSGKGGVGKTTTSANVGTGLAKAGSKVCLIDTDIGLRNLDVVMGLENRIVYNLVDVVEGNCRIKQALIRDKRHPGLYLMPSAQTRDKSAVTPGQMVKVIDHLREQFDYIILDCPAGIEQGFQNAIAGADSREGKRQRITLVSSRCRFFHLCVIAFQQSLASHVSRGDRKRLICDGRPLVDTLL